MGRRPRRRHLFSCGTDSANGRRDRLRRQRRAVCSAPAANTAATMPPSLPILDIGGGDHHRHDQPECTNQNRACAPGDFLVAVTANCRALCGSLDALALGTARRRFGTPLALPFPATERVHALGPDAVSTPAAEVPIDRLPLANVRRQYAPLTARRVDRENAIDHASERHRLPARATRSPLRGGRQSVEERPLRSADICGIARQGAPRQYSFPG
jgi:hypothetical protein